MKFEPPDNQDSLARQLVSFPGRFACATMTFALRQLVKSIDVRIAYYDSSADPSRQEYNEHCIFVFWHENMSLLLLQWPYNPVAMLISQHRDAGWLKYICDLTGLNCVRGSSTRGGAEAIRQLKKIKSKSSFVITPDGPLGPRREMALGPLFLASRLQMPIVPVAVGYDRPFRLSTWDKFAVPRPFSRGRIVFGPKIRLDRKLGRDELEGSRVATEALLSRLNDFATDWATSGTSVKQELPFVRTRRSKELEFDDSPPELVLPELGQQSEQANRKAA